VIDIEQNVRDSLRSYGDSVEVDVARFDDVVGRARRRSRRMTVAVASVALVATVTAVGLVARTDGNTRSIVPAINDTAVTEIIETPDTELTVEGPPSTTPGKLASLLALGESRVLPPSPLVGRAEPVSVWTGEDFLIWGGSDYDPTIGEVDLADGAAYNPVANTWTPLPDAPIVGRGLSAAVWTGTEMLIWGGSVKGASISDGAAYNPTTRAWRKLAPFTLTNTLRPTAIWTGNEMIVLDGFNGANVGAAYNPTTDTWRTIAEPPGRSVAPYPQAVWTGDRAVVELSVLGESPGDSPIIAAYDPIADSWQTMNPPSIPSGARPALLWTGSEMLMLGGGTGPKAAWNPTTDTWRTLASTDAIMLNNTPLWTGDAALFWNGGETALAYIPATDSWQILIGGALSSREEPATAWADGIFLTWSGFQSHPDGTAFGAADGLAWRPDIHGAASGGTLDTRPIVTAVETPTTAPAVDPSPTSPSATPTTPATEHQLQVLADAFSMPGPPDVHDASGGQGVSSGSRTLVVNVPLAGVWQYDDLDAQSLPPASAATSETAARSLLASLGIDTQGQVPTFKPNGPGTEIDLAGCSMLFAENGQIVYAIGPIAAIV
jgi:hypothetical protein